MNAGWGSGQGRQLTALGGTGASFTERQLKSSSQSLIYMRKPHFVHTLTRNRQLVGSFIKRTPSLSIGDYGEPNTMSGRHPFLVEKDFAKEYNPLREVRERSIRPARRLRFSAWSLLRRQPGRHPRHHLNEETSLFHRQTAPICDPR